MFPLPVKIYFLFLLYTILIPSLPHTHIYFYSNLSCFLLPFLSLRSLLPSVILLLFFLSPFSHILSHYSAAVPFSLNLPLSTFLATLGTKLSKHHEIKTAFGGANQRQREERFSPLPPFTLKAIVNGLVFTKKKKNFLDSMLIESTTYRGIQRYILKPHRKQPRQPSPLTGSSAQTTSKLPLLF